METEKLENLLEGTNETTRIDFKESCPWNIKKFAKDILAFSNIQDGGYLIIGIKEPFKRQGILEDHKATYIADEMKDQMSRYADPHVNFSVHFPIDTGGKHYVVIEIYEFIDIPVICKKDSEDTCNGQIYYRNTNMRVQSAQISNSYDMRNLIELATVKMMQKKSSIGFIAKDSDKEKFDEELNGL